MKEPSWETWFSDSVILSRSQCPRVSSLLSSELSRTLLVSKPHCPSRWESSIHQLALQLNLPKPCSFPDSAYPSRSGSRESPPCHPAFFINCPRPCSFLDSAHSSRSESRESPPCHPAFCINWPRPCSFPDSAYSSRSESRKSPPLPSRLFINCRMTCLYPNSAQLNIVGGGVKIFHHTLHLSRELTCRQYVLISWFCLPK